MLSSSGWILSELLVSIPPMHSPYETCWRLLRTFDLLTIKDVYRRLDEGAEGREIARMLKMHPSSWSRIKPLMVRVIHVPSNVMLDVLQKTNNARSYDVTEVNELVADTEKQLRLIYADGKFVSRGDDLRA